jgi:type VI protein secretion system component VasK
MNGGIAASYIDAGAIILGIFVFEVICWGIAWCWGARKRDGLRRSIVEAQLARQRAIEQAEEAREEEAERQLLENKRNQR